MFRVVSFEVTGINHHSAYDSRQAQPDDAPIESRTSPASSFPTVHPLAEIGIFSLDEDGRPLLQEILFGRKELIICSQDRATQTLCGKIDQVSKVHQYSQPSG